MCSDLVYILKTTIEKLLANLRHFEFWTKVWQNSMILSTVRLTPVLWINNQTVWCFIDLLESWCACSPWFEWQLRSEDLGMRYHCSTTVRVASWCQQCLGSGCYPTNRSYCFDTSKQTGMDSKFLSARALPNWNYFRYSENLNLFLTISIPHQKL